jgi:Tol biopolymer transport system component
VPVLDSLGEAIPFPRFGLSPDGTLIYVAGRSLGGGTGATYTLRLDNLSGGQEKIPLAPSDHWDAKFSPDGRRLAYIRNDHLWVYDLDLGTHTQLTREGTRHHNPAWSPDGTRIAFSQGMPGRADVDVFVADASGKSPVERFGGSDADEFPSQWLPDSSVLVGTQGVRGENVLVVRRGASDVTPILQADWVERDPRVSPDGRWLAYVSRESGRDHLYVRRWPTLENKVKVSEGDAPMAQSSFPLWSRDSRTLYYHQQQQIIAAIVMDAGDSVRITSRRVLEDGVRGILADLHPDGRRFLVLALDAATYTVAARAPRRLVVVTNWIALLRERLGK